MQILIRCVAEDDGDDVSSELFDWPVDDADARRHAAPELKPDTPAPGKLGGAELVQLVLSGAFSATSLGVVLAQWREQRRLAAAPKITVTVQKDGKQFAVTGVDPGEIQRKLDELDAA
ncbi:effector-associated constant component EACC1 [Streptomyces sp. IBSBF 2435]|uniref:effector-associated constant component EACC1 n=1 Tax=Streptomyces sp. IBSBF 2435 TaxID=2903531 RepID=UPI002FDC4264